MAFHAFGMVGAVLFEVFAVEYEFSTYEIFCELILSRCFREITVWPYKLLQNNVIKKQQANAFRTRQIRLQKFATITILSSIRYSKSSPINNQIVEFSRTLQYMNNCFIIFRV